VPRDPDISPEEEQSGDLPVAEIEDLEQLEGRPYSGLGQPNDKSSGSEPDNSAEGRPYSGK
jgi:hypothetical protein